MIYEMQPWKAFLVRLFSGLKIHLSRSDIAQRAAACRHKGITYPFDDRFMDRKRFVGLAAGAIENEEVTAAEQFLDSQDIIVEFGGGLGIAAARVHNTTTPKRHICFEANPLLGDYATKLFETNGLKIEYNNLALGSGQKMSFYALDDYILSSFERPVGRSDFKIIEVQTAHCQDIIDKYQPTALFCDVEGAELAYFDAQDFKSVRKIIIELHPQIYGQEGISVFKNRMKAHGFHHKLTKNDTYSFIR